MDQDWDLWAVVRSCTTAGTTTTRTPNPTPTPTIVENPFSNSASLTNFEKHDNQFHFPNLFESRRNNPFEELEQLCKPFFSKPQPISTPQITSAFPISVLGGFKDQQQTQQAQQQKQFQTSLASSAPTLPTTQTTHSQTPRSKKRKNQQKRVVYQLTEERHSSDTWAWRKYGQKPIKGSPYPRNYYRCSSSKGCVARKQVERSHLDPNMFIVTYTGEHTHPPPTHRNSLAGSTRNKFPIADQPSSGDSEPPPVTKSFSPGSVSTLSPTTPLTASIEDELAPHTTKKDTVEEDDEDMAVEEDEDDDILIPNMVMTEDPFMGLHNFDGFTNHFPPRFGSS